MPPVIIPVEPKTAPDMLKGVVDLPQVPGSDRIRILFIHGMGTQPGCYADTLLLHLTKALRTPLQILPPDGTIEPCPNFALPKPIPIPAPDAEHTALLYRYDFTGGGRQLTFMYLRWSTLTMTPKDTLAEPDHPDRAILSDLVKSFEQDYLADVVLYGGQYRDVIRPAMERALCRFVDGVPDQSDPRLCDGGEANIPTAIITHSLAGYMLMDAMSDIYNPVSSSRVPDKRSAAFKVGSFLNQIFMLANQLKMLDLSTRTDEEQTSRVADRFRATWDAVHVARPETEGKRPSRQILAISDPNDILSWEITRNEIRQPGVTVANVYLGTTGELFGFYHLPIWQLAASPVSAHTNYLQDDDVMDIIACGMTGPAINRCGLR
jgi:hypothetical protein